MLSDQTDTDKSLQRTDWIVLALILLYAAAGENKAADYWASPYGQGMGRLGAHAEARAAVRPYIPRLYRPRFWDGFRRQAFQQLQAPYRIGVEGVPILPIYRRQ